MSKPTEVRVWHGPGPQGGSCWTVSLVRDLEDGPEYEDVGGGPEEDTAREEAIALGRREEVPVIWLGPGASRRDTLWHPEW